VVGWDGILLDIPGSLELKQGAILLEQSLPFIRQCELIVVISIVVKTNGRSFRPNGLGVEPLYTLVSKEDSFKRI
jgi:hypothetical protein